MRFLKNKIALARAFQDKHKETDQEPFSASHKRDNQELNLRASHKPCPNQKRKRIPGFSITPEKSRQTKNIVKNFGKAICTFAISPIALPYLQPFINREQVELRDFTNYINNIKGNIDGLYHFRSILLSGKNDTKQIAAFKKIFKDISEVFIKYFSVNWIFHSKVLHKTAHLRFRFKMLRRIKSPELFTYLKPPKNIKKSRKEFESSPENSDENSS